MDLPEGSMAWGGLCKEFAQYMKGPEEGAEWSLLMAMLVPCSLIV